MAFFIYYLFTAAFNLEPVLNLTEFEAAILTTAPVLGFLPFLAALFDTLNTPNPVKSNFITFL